MIELLLLEDVDNLGKRGEKVSVKAGFARNHLIPLRYAVHANEDNLKMVEKRRLAWLAEEAKLIEELQELASHIAKLDLTIVEKATDQGHLYGSVTAKDVADAAAGSGVRCAIALRSGRPRPAPGSSRRGCSAGIYRFGRGP